MSRTKKHAVNTLGKSMQYRPEIDGLRAIAVVPVILFHAGFETFNGGFVGVDIFFVISGYLITSIIISDMNEGSFSLRNFYERRAKRILPTLFFVMAVSIPFAWLLLMPDDMKDFSQSLVATSIFSSNMLFWLESGYFDTAADLKPFLHTWSLAVEEQYYILFPLWLMLTWRLGERFIVIMLTGLAILSLSLSHWAIYNMPSAAFYLLPTRAWEIFLGAIVAFYLSKKNGVIIGRFASDAISTTGLILIILAIFTYDEKTPFPGLFALVPTIGVSLIILFVRKDTVVYQVLRNPIVAGIGLISYSAYLWHQPIFAFIKYRNVVEPSPIVMILLCVIILPLAFFSWRYLESPLRRAQGIRSTFTFVSIGFASSLFISVGLYGHFSRGFGNRLPPAHLDERFYTDLAHGGFLYGVDGDVCYSEMASMCRVSYGNGKKVLLVGDSHSGDFSLEYKKYADKHDLNAWQMSIGSCGFVPSQFYIHSGECKKGVDKFRKLIDIKELDEIIFVSNLYSHLRGLSVKEAYRDVEFLKNTFSLAMTNGIDVTYFSPRPTFSVSPVRAAFSDKMNLTKEVDEPFEKLVAFHIEEGLAPLGLHVFDQRALLSQFPCNDFNISNCGFKEGRPLYRDGNHLSAFGKSYVFNSYVSSIKDFPVVEADGSSLGEFPSM
jgi:peptidoglycan/LPS O-acetylase OafA/YrhL